MVLSRFAVLSISLTLSITISDYYHCNIDETEVLALADAFETLGLKAAGYE